MRISIVGSGHVGLVTGLCFAEHGHHVFCVDHDAAKIKKLKEGHVPFYEPGLEDMLRRHLESGAVEFSSSTAEAVGHGLAIFVCVSTPSTGAGHVDMRFFEAVARDIAGALGDYRLIVEKSTVPIHTSDYMKRTIRRYSRPELHFDVASNPEFLREGSAIADTLKPDRIVIGVETPKAEQILREIYAGFTSPMLVASIQSAELIKLASNAYLASRISFVNAISRICELGGADINEVTRGLALDSRIGQHFLKAGIGYGGSCFPKDADGMHAVAAELGYDFAMLRETQRVNDAQWRHFVERVERELWVLDGKTIALWGLSFKPDTDDIREAPAIKIARELLARGARVHAYDPAAMANAALALPELDCAKNPLDAARGADALLLCTEWAEFAAADPVAVKKAMRVPLIFDGRNFLDPVKYKHQGFSYRGVGRYHDHADD